MRADEPAFGRSNQRVFLLEAVHPQAPVVPGAAPVGDDAKGNMVADRARTFVRGTGDRLAEVTAGGMVTSFAYGPDGTRMRN